MEFFIARHPVFTRRREVYGYKLELCPSLMDRFYDLYREPDDAEALYRRLCNAAFSGNTGPAEAPGKPLAILGFSEELLESLIPLLPKACVLVEYNSADNSDMTELRDLRRIRARGFRILYDATVKNRAGVLRYIDAVKLDFSALRPGTQPERVAEGKGQTAYHAWSIDTWEDFKKALLLGFDYFEGDFFMRPLPGRKSDMRPFDTSALRVMSELASPEPSFREIANIIEHDLNLSYSLLRLVNSAYIAPRFRIKTISQAVTILGLAELSEFISTLAIKQMQSPENSELLRRSLLRGKLMDLAAGAGDLPQKGSEAFFVGIFSLLDVIIGKSMAQVLDELPLTDGVKGALLGEDGGLKSLLDMTRLYERGRWEEFDAAYGLDLTEQEKLMDHYLAALKWAESFDV
jgi:c-di-GMP-related signal transduction protein